MALLIKHSLDNGIVCEDAYLKLFGDISISSDFILIRGIIYANKEARQTGKIEIGNINLYLKSESDIPLDETKRIALLYSEIKKISEYSDAKDC